MKETDPIERTRSLLDEHYDAFFSTVEVARETGHTVPMDTKSWSQIIVSVLTGIKGLERKKGADLDDGSDVKAANTWEAIDTPRFNGVLKAGTKSAVSDSMSWLDEVPYLFFVLWDETKERAHRCRIWVARPQEDPAFREMAKRWYKLKEDGAIVSNNFQLHPPRGLDVNIIRNKCGNLVYPLLYHAERKKDAFYEVVVYDENVMKNGVCESIESSLLL